ncbi:hypothetical protein JG687_00003267 [Phytophthora cactorum]|uniref:Uncharacterized protein n=1 Tax=Phytophthora cactorum TaxID=29920 RepID=A0A329SAF1_9STRA|nr:hypothetical protein Pcac1_g25901 [Phytophthora cactorum]KAG2826310.1 hypothetical protein PC111_g9006 [Phytophthora cactorum]KAG2848693.1 hypothetical protein PC112_g631 [Phytophthora cactorum]KAG2867678.1 hypothetical protein PC113_g1742 [Phytophthora cactorum]KAG2931628.1 hypothetical protein PC114_g2124 [Phytophthora cactorum]
MPPLSATTERVKPFLLVPVKKSDIGHKSAKDGTTNFCQDGWLEKVFERQEVAEPKKRKQKHKQNFIQRTLRSLTLHPSKTESESTKNAYDGHSYQEELRQYIAESSANLLYDDDEPLRSSDEDASDEDSDPVSVSPRNAEIIDFSASIVSISSDKTDEYVQPPVEVPRKYRTQDRQGGVLVAGHHVLFTNWAFKQQMRHMGRLGPLPERGEAQLSYIDEAVEEVSIGIYSGKIVEL